MYAWTLTTHFGTRVFYDRERGLLRHHVEDEHSLHPIWLVTPDNRHGVLISSCPDALHCVLPVRIRLVLGRTCNILSAQIGLEEKLYSARPTQSESPNTVIALQDHAELWEDFELQAAPVPLSVCELDIRAFADLVNWWPEPEGLLPFTASGWAIRWYLAMRDTAYLDRLGVAAIREPGHGFLRTLAASAFLPAMRAAYGSLAEWLEDRDGTRPIEHLGEVYNVFDPYPNEMGFNLEFEINARIRRGVEPSKRFCVVATMRNEGPYIIEWLSYYKALGFEAFFVYSNENDDGSDDLLRELARKGYLTLISNDATRARPQFKAYGHALKALPQLLDYEWALFVDADEFLVLDPERFTDITSYIDWLSVRPVDAVAFCWLMYRSLGTERADLETPVTRRFVKRLAAIDHHIKSIIKPREFYHAHAHYPFEPRGLTARFLDANGDCYTHGAEKAHSHRPITGAAWINHYWSRSDEEFCLKQARNGGNYASTFRRPPSEIRAMLEEMRQVDAHQAPMEDRCVLRFTHAADTVSYKIMADAEISVAHRATVELQKRRRDELMSVIWAA